MKFLSVLFALTLCSSIAFAQDAELSKVSEDMLLEGLTIAAACVATDAAGITVLSKLSRDQMNEPASNSQELVTAMHHDSLILFNGIKQYSDVGTVLVEEILKKNHLTTAQLQKRIEEEIKNTRQDILVKLDDVTDYADFQEKFEPMLNHCNNVSASFQKTLESLLGK